MIMVQQEGIRDIHHSTFVRMLNNDDTRLKLITDEEQQKPPILVMGVFET